MNIVELPVGASVEVFSVSGAGERISFKTKVEDIRNKNIVVVWVNDVLPRYTAARTFDVFYRHQGDDHMWEMQNEGIERSMEGFLYFRMKVVDPESEISSRREHFRITYLSTGLLHFVDESSNLSANTEVDLVDISGGGVAVLADVLISQDKLARLAFKLGAEEMLLPLKVVSREDMPDGFRVPYRYRCKWDMISVGMEEKIVRFVFQRQRDMRNKNER